MSTKAPALSMSMFASSADYWKAQAEQADAQVARFMDQVNLQTAELETLRAKVKELALQALSDSGQAIENLIDAERYRWLKRWCEKDIWNVKSLDGRHALQSNFTLDKAIDAAIDAARAADAAIR